MKISAEERNNRISFIGWFFVWLKDKDNGVIVKTDRDRVYFSHKTISSMKDFTDYLKKELELYIYENCFMQDKTDLYEMIKDKRKKIFALLKRDVNFLVLNIKNYRFKF
jgi:hypothetical protein